MWYAGVERYRGSIFWDNSRITGSKNQAGCSLSFVQGTEQATLPGGVSQFHSLFSRHAPCCEAVQHSTATVVQKPDSRQRGEYNGELVTLIHAPAHDRTSRQTGRTHDPMHKSKRHTAYGTCIGRAAHSPPSPHAVRRAAEITFAHKLLYVCL